MKLITFELTEEQTARFVAWREQIDNEVAAKQVAEGSDLALPGLPYYGTCGGAYTFSFTNTGIGLVIKVRNGLNGQELDLSDYETW